MFYKIKIVAILILGQIVFSPSGLYSQNNINPEDNINNINPEDNINNINPENNITKEFFSKPKSYDVLQKVAPWIPDYSAIYSPGEAKLKITEKGYIEEYMAPPQSFFESHNISEDMLAPQTSYIFENLVTDFIDSTGPLYQLYDSNDPSDKVVIGVYFDRKTNNCYFGVFEFLNPERLMLYYYLVIKDNVQWLEIIKESLEDGNTTDQLTEHNSDLKPSSNKIIRLFQEKKKRLKELKERLDSIQESKSKVGVPQTSEPSFGLE